MKVIIRTDASVQIGSGHVMRCLTVAEKLRAAGCHVRFWMKQLEGNLIDFVSSKGFQHIEQAEQADLYIIDHYDLGMEWEQQIRAYTKNVAVIDDLAREHDCDVLLDQNFVPGYETRYEGKVPKHCKTLIGPKYLIMREEFILARQNLRSRNQDVQRLLVFMGGSDPTNETMKILNALQHFAFQHVDVVVGNGNPEKQRIQSICAEQGYHYHCQIDYMAMLMLQADFTIGAGGSTLWERCYVGLPSSSTIVADNQRVGTIYAGELGLTKNLGWHEQVTIKTYMDLLSNLQVNNMSELGLALTKNNQPNPWLHELLELK